MDKSLFFFVLIGVGFFYFITQFVGDIQEDDKFQNEEYKQKQQYEKYKSVDSIGRTILDLTDAPIGTQFQIWNNSELKTEFLNIFPDFSDMKIFIHERVRGDALKARLTAAVDDAESQYFSGAMDAEQAKRSLSSLK